MPSQLSLTEIQDRVRIAVARMKTLEDKRAVLQRELASVNGQIEQVTSEIRNLDEAGRNHPDSNLNTQHR